MVGIFGNSTDTPPKPGIGLIIEGYLHRRQKIIPIQNQTILVSSWGSRLVPTLEVIDGTVGIFGNTTDTPPEPSICLTTKEYLHRHQKTIPTPNWTILVPSWGSKLVSTLEVVDGTNNGFT